jgi:hypothetical protein
VGEFVVESVLKSLANAESPVAGASWPDLSPKYKDKKEGEGLNGEPNMELSGDMLDSLDFRETRDGIEVGIFGREAWKADGHLKFSGAENNTPRRQFLPDETNGEFVPGIQREMEKIIADAIGDEMEFKPSDFEDVSSRAGLYDALDEYFPDFSRADIREIITNTPSLVRFLDDAGLLELL